MTQTIPQLFWRAAIKQYDTTKKLTDSQVELLVEAARLSATSYGLQPVQLLMITNKEVREKLQAAAYGQPQLTEASHLFVLTARTEITQNDITQFIQTTAKQRSVDESSLKGLGDMMSQSLLSRTTEAQASWAAKQAYIVLGTMLTVAAYNKIDTSPMEGFDAAQFNTILGLSDTGFTSVVVLAAGHRSKEDKYSKMAKVRKDRASFLKEI